MLLWSSASSCSSRRSRRGRRSHGRWKDGSKRNPDDIKNKTVYTLTCSGLVREKARVSGKIVGPAATARRPTRSGPRQKLAAARRQAHLTPPQGFGSMPRSCFHFSGWRFKLGPSAGYKGITMRKVLTYCCDCAGVFAHRGWTAA